jgi:phosphatidylethanolamine-binding protein (PEBP) family uncharacterized protein
MRTLILTVMAALPAAALADPPKPAAPPLDVTSTAFQNNATIPAEYTCEGTGTAPPLTWSRVPTAT